MASKLTFEQLCRRAASCRRYNARRQETALERCQEVARLLRVYGQRRRGVQARIARELGVSEVTISRDMPFARFYADHLEKLDELTSLRKL